MEFGLDQEESPVSREMVHASEVSTNKCVFVMACTQRLWAPEACSLLMKEFIRKLSFNAFEPERHSHI